MCDPVNYAV